MKAKTKEEVIDAEKNVRKRNYRESREGFITEVINSKIKDERRRRKSEGDETDKPTAVEKIYL